MLGSGVQVLAALPGWLPTDVCRGFAAKEASDQAQTAP